MPKSKVKMGVTTKKTAAEALQELVLKNRVHLEYECSTCIGTKHMFKSVCTVGDYITIGKGLNKKLAKQESAKAMLITLSQNGYRVPPPWCAAEDATGEEDQEDQASCSGYTRA